MLKRKKVYICSPLSAETKEGVKANMLKARNYEETISECLECRAIAPHAWLPEFLDDTILEERELGLSFGKVILYKCYALIICGEYISSGMKEEIKYARSLEKPVYQWMVNQEGHGVIRIYKPKGEDYEM